VKYSTSWVRSARPEAPDAEGADTEGADAEGAAADAEGAADAAVAAALMVAANAAVSATPPATTAERKGLWRRRHIPLRTGAPDVCSVSGLLNTINSRLNLRPKEVPSNGN